MKLKIYTILPISGINDKRLATNRTENGMQCNCKKEETEKPNKNHGRTERRSQLLSLVRPKRVVCVSWAIDSSCEGRAFHYIMLIAFKSILYHAHVAYILIDMDLWCWIWCVCVHCACVCMYMKKYYEPKMAFSLILSRLHFLSPTTTTTSPLTYATLESFPSNDSFFHVALPPVYMHQYVE